MIEEHIRKKITSAVTNIPQADSFASSRLSLLIEELEKWNKKYNLTAIRAPNEMIHGHIMDSLSALEFIKGKDVIDIGTGAGFPGLPLAIMRPKNHFLLIDGNGKKIGFIQHIISLFELKNVQAKKIRAENFFPDQLFDTVIARALTTLPKLISLSEHLLKEHGTIVAMKGKLPIKELNSINNGWQHQVHPIRIDGMTNRERHIILLNKERKCEL